MGIKKDTKREQEKFGKDASTLVSDGVWRRIRSRVLLFVGAAFVVLSMNLVTDLIVNDPTLDAPEGTASDASGDEARETFKDLLRAYDNERTPEIANPGFAAWSARKKADLEAARQAAVDDFAAADYGPAIRKIKALDQQTEQAIAAWETSFTKARTEAKEGVRAGDHTAALTAVTRALRMRPGDAETEALKQRVDALPAILDALKRARVARAEANPQAEIAAIEEVLKLDPARTDLAARRDELTAQLRETRFTEAIQAGLQHVDASAVDLAKEQLKIAEALAPGRDETRILRNRVEALERSIAVRTLLGRAARAVKGDQWQTVLDSYKNILAIDPDNGTALQGRDAATEVLDLQARIDRHLANPTRLSSVNIRAQAEEILTRIRVPAALSPSITTAGDKLSALLKLYVKEVPVRVLSDGETAIAVRGVGHVGQTLDKIIRLKPGTYTFEGKRVGHVSKLMKLTVPAGANMVEVKIVCDEPI